MKILVVHNFYKQSGGEDRAVLDECHTLRQAGHDVVEYFENSGSIDPRKVSARLQLAVSAPWCSKAYSSILQLLRLQRPEVAHFHNTWPLISAAGYYACRRAGVPVVQTLHNYRLYCPAGTFFRAGRTCEECVEHGYQRSVVHACYRSSVIQSAVLAGSLALHHAVGTYARMVDLYIVPSEFARRKFVSLGLPAANIEVKSNFVALDPGPDRSDRGFGLFVGRLSAEKGLGLLIDAWRSLAEVPLRILGDGPLLEWLKQSTVGSVSEVEVLGQRTRDETMGAMKQAGFLVLPSESYEGFPVVIAEAFACGLPVIASRLGAMQEIVEEGRTGLLFDPGDSRDLAKRVRWAWEHPKELREMGREARSEYLRKYTADHNHAVLLRAYLKAIARTHTSLPSHRAAIHPS